MAWPPASFRAALLATTITAMLAAQDERRHGPASPERGLPRDAASFRPYDDRADHPANRIFQRLWLQRMAPAEVAETVSQREEIAWTAGWVHRKRQGTDADTRWFGGDGRLLPLEGLAAEPAADLRALLDGVRDDGDVARTLRARPDLAVLFQHDLLRAAERLHDTGQNPDLVPMLLRVAQAVALDAATLASLRDPLRTALADGHLQALAATLPSEAGGKAAGWREVLRRSTRLFDAGKSLLWSRVYLAHPDGPDALAALLPKPGEPAGKGPTVPVGFRAVLVQGIVAVDRDGAPRATPLVFDVRTQVLANREPLAATNPTWSHDGVDFGVWQLEREGLRRGDAAAFFRRIDADDQDLFRDYGTAKHTTYRGQCSLCHRLSDTPEPHLGGFPVLRPHAQAAFAVTGQERLHLAEAQAGQLLLRLRAAR